MRENIAVIDIGKTNKKLLIYNQDLELVDRWATQIETKTFDGLEVEDTDATRQWLMDGLKDLNQKHKIDAVSITTHGATFACLDSQGELVLPVLSYTNDPGNEFHEEFFQKFGNPDELQEATATANFNLLLNVGKGIYFLKKKYREQFKKISVILNYPQYWAFLLSGRVSVEPTFVGCHTYLWDFRKNDWSALTDKMGIRNLFPKKMDAPWKVIGKVKETICKTIGLADNTIVTSGIHDSNASILPYLIRFKEEFLLNSTGTWCVIMKESDKVVFSPDEIGKTVFYNINAFGNPIKTTIFMGGQEFDTYRKLIVELNQTDEIPNFNFDLYQQIINENSAFLMPSVVKGTGQFPDSEPRVIYNGKKYLYSEMLNTENIPELFNDIHKAYAVLNISIALQTVTAMKRAGIKDGMPVCIEGGFRKNDSYIALLSALFPKSKVFLSNIEEATAFGTAILGKAALGNRNPKELESLIQIETDEVKPVRIENFAPYIKKYTEYLEER